MINNFMLKLDRGLPRENKASRAGWSNVKHPHRQKTSSFFWAVMAAAGGLLASNTMLADGLHLSREFNKPGNILIADQFNNRVIEIDKAGNIRWSFGLGTE